MAGAALVNATGKKEYAGEVTVFVFLTCLVASTGGLILGYDIGISGGVTSMHPFLIKFFPSVDRESKTDTGNNQYCKFDSQLLTAFTSSLYLAALFASFFASATTSVFGRKWSMFWGGVTFFLGAVFNGGAQNIAMLIIGRILLGVGVGFAGQSVPLYLSEMAPAHHRGMLNISFQFMITIGIFVANLINYVTAKIKGDLGWRISLGLAAIPAAIITLGSFFLPDTPSSLIYRGFTDKAKQMLRKIRGIEDVEDEFNSLLAAGEESKAVKHPWANIIERRYRPQLTMAILIPFFQQLTGINVIMFYAPVLFKAIGFGSDGSLMSAVIIGLVNVGTTVVSIVTVDKLGRRTLFLEGGVQMFISQVVVGTLMWVKFGVSGEAHLSKWYAIVVVVFICVYVAGFAWSWGPLASLVPSEIFPLEIRSAGQSVNLSVNMLLTFAIAQSFLAMLCSMKFGVFYFFGGWVAIMTTFVALFLPETKNLPIEEVVIVWKSHWFWSKFVADKNVNVHRGTEMT